MRIRRTTINNQDHAITTDRTLQKHIDLVNNVMKRIRKSELKQSNSKCAFGAKSITFLGHRLSKEKI